MPRSPRDRSRVAALCLAALASGCSFRIMRPAPPASEWPNPVLPSSSQLECTDSFAPPIGDTGVTAALGTIATLERHSGSPAVTAGIGLAAIPFLISAIYGYVEAIQCHRYDARFTPSP
jgi:hypothetical protein